ncbi:hypothetical protein GW17_00062298 [Ensete ventricosum]|nr:hypothetical protein GW17_00062298 [Ensete ventricosum]
MRIGLTYPVPHYAAPPYTISGGLRSSCPCALVRPRSSRDGVSAQLDGWIPRTSSRGLAAGVVELGSGGGTSGRVGRQLLKGGRSLYSGCCRSSVPGNLAALVAYHVVIHFHHARRPCVRHDFTSKGVDLTCVRSVVRPLAPPYLRPTCFPHRVGHVGRPVVRGRKDVAARSSFALSFFPSREELLEVPDEGAEDEFWCLAADPWWL